MKTFKEFILESESRTLEHKLKFDNGLTIETLHHVQIIHSGKSRDVAVFISNRGKVGVSFKSVKAGVAGVATSVVKGDAMGSSSFTLKPYDVEQFEDCMAKPVVAKVEI